MHWKSERSLISMEFALVPSRKDTLTDSQWTMPIKKKGKDSTGKPIDIYVSYSKEVPSVSFFALSEYMCLLQRDKLNDHYLEDLKIPWC